MVHKPRWQPLGYLSRKLRNKSILLQASLFLHRLEREALVINFKSRVAEARESHDYQILIAVVY